VNTGSGWEYGARGGSARICILIGAAGQMAMHMSSPGNPFSLIVGIPEILSGIKYVITLDRNTQLPRDLRGALWAPWRPPG